MESSFGSDSSLSQNPINNNTFLEHSLKNKSDDNLEIATEESDCKEDVAEEREETEEFKPNTDLKSIYSKEKISKKETKESIQIPNAILNEEVGIEDATIISLQIKEPFANKEVDNDITQTVAASISNSDLIEPEQKIKLLQKDIDMLKEKHAEMLKSLHGEVDVLKRKNTDLQYTLISHGLLRLDENMEEGRDQNWKGHNKPIKNPSLKFEDNIEGGNSKEKTEIDERSDSKMVQKADTSGKDELCKQYSKNEIEQKQELSKNEKIFGKKEEISKKDQNELKTSGKDIEETPETNKKDTLFESHKRDDDLENSETPISSKYTEAISCTGLGELQTIKDEKAQSNVIKEKLDGGVNLKKEQEICRPEEAPFKRSKIDIFIPSPDVNGNRGYTCSIL